MTANTVAGPLDRPHRSGGAAGNHQDPPAALLLSRRTAHPLGPPPHPAPSQGLALGIPVQPRPGPASSYSILSLTALPPQTSPFGPLNIPENSRRPCPRASPAARLPANLAQRRHCGPPLEHRETAAGPHQQHLWGLSLNRHTLTSIIPRLASMATPFGGFRLRSPLNTTLRFLLAFILRLP